MSTIAFALLALVCIELSRDADNEPGRVVLGVASAFLLTCAMLVAPWGDVFA